MKSYFPEVDEQTFQTLFDEVELLIQGLNQKGYSVVSLEKLIDRQAYI